MNGEEDDLVKGDLDDLDDSKFCIRRVSNFSAFSGLAPHKNSNLRRKSVCYSQNVLTESRRNADFAEWLFSIPTSTLCQNDVDKQRLPPDSDTKRTQQQHCFIEPFYVPTSSQTNTFPIKKFSESYNPNNNFRRLTHCVSMLSTQYKMQPSAFYKENTKKAENNHTDDVIQIDQTLFKNNDNLKSISSQKPSTLKFAKQQCTDDISKNNHKESRMAHTLTDNNGIDKNCPPPSCRDLQRESSLFNLKTPDYKHTSSGLIRETIKTESNNVMKKNENSQKTSHKQLQPKERAQQPHKPQLRSQQPRSQKPQKQQPQNQQPQSQQPQKQLLQSQQPPQKEQTQKQQPYSKNSSETKSTLFPTNNTIDPLSSSLTSQTSSSVKDTSRQASSSNTVKRSFPVLPSLKIKEKYTLLNGSLRATSEQLQAQVCEYISNGSNETGSAQNTARLYSQSQGYYSQRLSKDVIEAKPSRQTSFEHRGSFALMKKPLAQAPFKASSYTKDLAQTNSSVSQNIQSKDEEKTIPTSFRPPYLRLPTRSMTTAVYRQNVGENTNRLPLGSYRSSIAQKNSSSKFVLQKPANEGFETDRSSAAISNRLVSVNTAIAAINRRFSLEHFASITPNKKLACTSESAPHEGTRQQKLETSNETIHNGIGERDNILQGEKVPFSKRVKHAFSLAVSLPTAFQRQFSQHKNMIGDGSFSSRLYTENKSTQLKQSSVCQSRDGTASQPLAVQACYSNTRDFIVSSSNQNSSTNDPKQLVEVNSSVEMSIQGSETINEEFSLEQSLDKGNSDGQEDALKTIVALVSLKGVKPMLHTHHRSASANLNQDRAFIQSLQSNVTAFAVFDGHGEYGHEVAQFVADQFREILINELGGHISLVQPLQSEKHLLQWMRNSFRRIDKKLIKCHPVPFNLAYSGTTGSLAVRVNNAIYVGYVGDSKVVGYCFQGATAVKVMETPEHNPVSAGESQRIRKTGGRVSEVFFQHLNKAVSRIVEAGISVSRSFGDLQARQFGLICEPELVKFDIEPQPHVLKQTLYPMILVVASDGLWDTLSTQEVLQFFDNQRHSKDVLMSTLKKMILASWKKRLSLEGRSDDTTAILALISASSKTAFQET